MATNGTASDSLRSLIQERLDFFDRNMPAHPVIPENDDLATIERLTIKWKPPPPTVAPPPSISIDEARTQLADTLREYLSGDDERILLVSAPAGLGKTHTVITVAQEMAEYGYRIGLFMDRHDMYGDLQEFPHFDDGEWYHWLSLHHDNPEAPDETMCVLHREAKAWISRGYPLIKMCQALCAPSGYMGQCAYRAQAQRPERIIAGVHEHSVSGMSIRDYRAVIVDEMPLRAFMKQRHIPKNHIPLSGVIGPVAQLTNLLKALSDGAGTGKSIRAKRLLDIIGPVLADVYALDEMEHGLGNWSPAIPDLHAASEAYEADYWYLQDLLLLLTAEYTAWKNGWDDWLSRVIVTQSGLTLLGRAQPWKKLPQRLVILDATGNSEIYRLLFGRDVIEWKPSVRRAGKFYQIADRLNGLTQLTDTERYEAEAEDGEDDDNTVIKTRRVPNHLAVTTLEYITALTRQRGYVNPGVVTHKALRPMFEQAGFAAAHFYGQRGTNQLEDCDAIFVLGCPSPSNQAIINTFASLNPDELTPFSPKTDEQTGRITPVRTAREVCYPYENAHGLSPHRMVSGFWWFPALQDTYNLFRENELYQAIHRGRVLSGKKDVWLLTTIQVPGERLDRLYETADKAMNCPDTISWQHWLKIMAWMNQAGPDDVLTYDILSELTGVGYAWASRNKWLEKIRKTNPGDWEIVGLRVSSRGRKKQALRRHE